MNDDLTAEPWSEPGRAIAQHELAGLCQLSVDELEELVEYWLLQPVSGARRQHTFSGSCVEPLRRAAAQRVRFDLEVFVVGLMFRQFEEIDLLRRQLRWLQAHLPHAGSDREGPALWLEPHS